MRHLPRSYLRGSTRRERSRIGQAALDERELGVGGGNVERSAVVRESIRRAAGAAEQVGAGGVQEVALPQVRVEVEGVEEGEASIRAIGEGDGDRSVEVD